MNRRQFAKLILGAPLVGLPGIAALSGCAGPEITQPTAVPKAPLRWRGADISFMLQQEAIGTVLTDLDGVEKPVERILAGHGANAIRLRLWVNPPAGSSDEASLLALARRAAAAGMQIVVDLHYSDTWADHSAQSPPAAWAEQSLSELTNTVREYTRRVVSALKAQGTPASAVQVGNEVGNGMLWPAGQVYFGSGRQEWSGFAELLKAGIDGVRSVAGTDEAPETVLHLQLVQDSDGLFRSIDNLVDRGVEVDVIGLSYYPFWHGPLDTLRSTLSGLANRYPDTDLLIAETSYPWTLDDGGEAVLYVDSGSDLPDERRFGPTPQGQAGYFTALREVLLDIPGGRGAGLFVWEPGWLPGVAAAPPAVANPYANLTMFDYTGAGLPSLQTAFMGPASRE